ncbi:MAG: GNAT family N-acetyltransferase [Huintestinicola sp.]|uniref:GNAT family N-acetyltransferase n=1 Tax=Huintestinicola sp. TaxID=2981661 RepID=UPI003F0A1725
MEIAVYKREYHDKLIRFLEKCLPESGRALDINGRHKAYSDVERYYSKFWCLLDDDNIIGAVAVKELNADSCELKSLYLLKKYQGRKLGYALLQTAVSYAVSAGYKKMYLDTFSTSTRAVSLYEKAGFVYTERYNGNYNADVFMVMDLKADGNANDREELK